MNIDSITDNQRGYAQYLPSYTASCGDNPPINNILDSIDDNFNDYQAYVSGEIGELYDRIAGGGTSSWLTMPDYGEITLTSGDTIHELFNIKFDNFIPNDYMQVGGVVQFEQLGNTKQGYVMHVSEIYNEIAVLFENGSLPSLSQEVENFEFSWTNEVRGFNRLFRYAPTVTKSSGSGTISVSNNLAFFEVKKDRIRVQGTFDMTYTATDSPVIKVTLPFPNIVIGDINDDGIVDALDLSILFGDWNGLRPRDVVTFDDRYSSAPINTNVIINGDTYKSAWITLNNNALQTKSDFEIHTVSGLSSTQSHKFHYDFEFYFACVGNQMIGFPVL